MRGKHKKRAELRRGAAIAADQERLGRLLVAEADRRRSAEIVIHKLASTMDEIGVLEKSLEDATSVEVEHLRSEIETLRKELAEREEKRYERRRANDRKLAKEQMKRGEFVSLVESLEEDGTIYVGDYNTRGRLPLVAIMAIQRARGERARGAL